MNTKEEQNNKQKWSIHQLSGYKFWDFVFKWDDLFKNINQENQLETIIMDKNNPMNFLENEKYKFKDLIQTKMTKDRWLKLIKNTHPIFFKYFLEKYKSKENKIQNICEIGSGEWVLLNEIVRKYKISATGIDAVHPKNKSLYTQHTLDIRHFDKIPVENNDIISLYTLMYAPNSLFGIETIFQKMSIWSEARLDLWPIDLYSEALIEYLKKNNKDNNIRFFEELIAKQGKEEQKNLVIYLNKKSNHDSIHIPEKYIVVRWISKKTGSSSNIWQYMCNYFLKDDPEFEKITMSNTKETSPLHP